MRYLLLILALLPGLVLAEINFSANFDASPGADSYTVYQVNGPTDLIAVGSGTSPPILFALPDDHQGGAFVLTASNAFGESAPSGTAYWYPPDEPIIIEVRPNTPINLVILPAQPT